MGWHDQFDLSFRDCSKDVAMVTVLAPIGENWRNPSSFCALAAGIPQRMEGSQHGCAR